MRNKDYNYAAFATQASLYREDLEQVEASVSKWVGQLGDSEDVYFPYAHDHAAETLARTAKRLREIADRMESLIKYTNYPPVEHQN